MIQVLYFDFQLKEMMVKKAHRTQNFISSLYFLEHVTPATYIFDFYYLLSEY